MSVDLKKNHNSLQSAWKDVLNDKTDTNWALFGYEGQTNVLKVVSTGSDGLEELKEDLNSGKIMYAFVRINDTKTSLDKNVLINWQGDGANTTRKAICANHLRDVERYFAGANLVITARNDDEVEPDFILEKLKKCGSEYRFKIKPEPAEPSKPVGTTYQRVNAVKEINSQERDKFWRKEEEEEKHRKQEEKKKKHEEQMKLELEITQREEMQTRKREEVEEQRSREIDQIKQAESAVESDRVVKRSKTPEKPVRTSILKLQNVEVATKCNISNSSELFPSQSPENKVDPNVSDEENEQFSTIKRSPKDATTKTPVTPTSPKETKNNENIIQSCPEQTLQMTEQDFVDEYIYGIKREVYNLSKEIRARALYDYQAADDTEISFDPGDVITNIEQVDEGWWQGLAPDGISYGLFPANYVELMN